jgi:hypothetical protein
MVFMNKNIKLLKDFEKYCITHPKERFWQALRNWGEVNSIIIERHYAGGIITKKDTFYFEGKDK